MFLLTLLWLVAEFGQQGRDVWKRIIVAYDNMCHLNNLRVARKELPLPGELRHIWMDVTKVIDRLHMSNHVDPSCHKLYSMDNIKVEENKHFNTMACEQTFAWLSRHKKILCAMPKNQFHFYLHRMVKRRNKYITHAYTSGQRKVIIKNTH